MVVSVTGDRFDETLEVDEDFDGEETMSDSDSDDEDDDDEEDEDEDDEDEDDEDESDEDSEDSEEESEDEDVHDVKGGQEDVEVKTEESGTSKATSRAHSLSSAMMSTLVRLKQMYPFQKRARRMEKPVLASTSDHALVDGNNASQKPAGMQQRESVHSKLTTEAMDAPRPLPVMKDLSTNTDTVNAGMVIPNEGSAQRLHPPSPFRYGLTNGDESGYMSSDSMEDGRVGLLKPASMAASSPQSRMQRRHLQSILRQGQGEQGQRRRHKPRDGQEFATSDDIYRNTRGKETSTSARYGTTRGTT